MKNSSAKNKIENFDFNEFETLSPKVKQIFDAAKQDESESNLHSLDLKVSALLQEKGEEELAEKILNSQFQDDKSIVSEGSIFPVWFTAALGGFLAVISVGIIIVNFNLIGLKDKKNDPPVADIQKSDPVITLKPKNLTTSGAIAQENEFIIQFEGTLAEEDIKEKIKIEPEIGFEVDVSEESGVTTIALKPTEILEKNVNYSISVENGLKFEDGEKLEESVTWAISVEPKLSVINNYPKSGADNLPLNSPIYLDLSENVNKTELEEAFTITPDIRGVISSVENRYYFMPTENLLPNSEYTVTILPKFSESNNLDEEYKFTFSTGAISSSEVDSPLSWSQSDSVEYIEGKVDATILNPDQSLPTFSAVRFNLYFVDSESGVQYLAQNLDNPTGLPEGARLIDTAGITLNSGANYQKETFDNGLYVLSAYSGSTDTIVYKYFLRSDLIVVGREHNGKSEGYLYNAKSVTPIEGAAVKSFSEGKVIGESKTLGDGSFAVENSDLIMLSAEGNYTLFSDQLFQSYSQIWPSHKISPFKSLVVTDSEVYSPNQQVNVDIFLLDPIREEALTDGEVKLIFAKSPLLKWSEVGSDKIIDESTYILNSGWVSAKVEVPSSTDDIYLFVIKDSMLTGVHMINIDGSVGEIKNSLNVQIEKDVYLEGESVTAKLEGEGEVFIDLYRREINLTSSQINETGETLSDTHFGRLIKSERLNLNEKKQFIFTPLLDSDGGVGFIYTVAIRREGEGGDIQPKFDSAKVFYDNIDVKLLVSDENIADKGSIILQLESKDRVKKQPIKELPISIQIYQTETEYNRVIGNGSTKPGSILIAGRIYQSESSSQLVLDKNDLKSGADGKVKFEIVDLKPGYYDVTIKYGTSEATYRNAFSIEQVDNQNLLLQSGSVHPLNLEVATVVNQGEESDSENENLEEQISPLSQLKLSLVDGAKSDVIVYWYSNKLNTAVVSESQNNIVIPSDFTSLCTYGRDSEGDWSQSCGWK